jgi:hypothetical protein
MNKNIVFSRAGLVILGIVSSLVCASANTYTVDNRPGRAADFDSLQDAIAAALPGDTLYVMGSQFTYGNITLGKPLTIVGPGYLLGANEIAIAEANHANLNSLTITANASGSTFVGLHIGGTFTSQYTQIDGATDITFRRCYFHRAVWVGMSSRVERLSFEQCFHPMGAGLRLGDHSSDPGAGNVVVSNSLFRWVQFSNDRSEILIDQSVLGGMNIQNGVVRNSIFTSQQSVDFTSVTVIENCLRPGNVLPQENGNINNANLDLVFVGWNSGNPPGSATADTWTQLIPSALNPALGAGSNGQDLGMYGGSFPYVVSGVPPLPRITSLRAPAVIGVGETITVDVEVAAGE